MKNSSFSIYNLRQNNLSIPEIKIPLHNFVLVQGQSGSGKSSFAIDILLREGQKRLLSALRIPSSDIPPVKADFLDPLPTTLGCRALMCLLSLGSALSMCPTSDCRRSGNTTDHGLRCCSPIHRNLDQAIRTENNFASEFNQWASSTALRS